MDDAAIAFASPADALRAAVERLGSQAAMGRLVGVKQPSVFRWLDQGKSLPAEHVLTVERATGISRHALRPDLYPTGDAPLGDAEDSLFGRFGGVPAMAEALSLPIAEVLRWRDEHRVPAEQQPFLLRRAQELGLDVSAEDVIFPFPEDRGAG
jgi:DNA-binding transcriptional regulator YdaS (Cro superfamily)